MHLCLTQSKTKEGELHTSLKLQNVMSMLLMLCTYSCHTSLQMSILERFNGGHCNLIHMSSSGFFFFFFWILWCSHIDNHPQGELTKFGYRSERTVEIFKNPDMFWCPAGTYFLNMVISEKNSGDFWCIFLTKILCVSLIGLYFFVAKWPKFFPKKNTDPHEGWANKTNKSWSLSLLTRSLFSFDNVANPQCVLLWL
jgi:hypothetical protein